MTPPLASRCIPNTLSKCEEQDNDYYFYRQRLVGDWTLYPAWYATAMGNPDAHANTTVINSRD